MKSLEHLESKRYRAIILLGPPLRVFFAFAVFAGLHLGLGLPWLTLEDAGIVASLLEILGLLLLLIAVDLLVLSGIYRTNFFRPGWFSRKQDMDVAEILRGIPGMLIGYTIVMIMDGLYMKSVAGLNAVGGTTVLLVTFASMFVFMNTVQQGERTHRDRPSGAADESDA